MLTFLETICKIYENYVSKGRIGRRLDSPPRDIFIFTSKKKNLRICTILIIL